MSASKDFDKLIQDRLESLGLKPKEKLSIKPVKEQEPTEALRDDLSDPTPDEGLGKTAAARKAKRANQKLKQRHLNGYKNKQGRKRG